MKLMDENTMLEVVQAGADSRKSLGARMRPLYAGKTASWLADGTRSGHYKVSEVRSDGKAIGVFWWWWSANNRALVVNAAGSLSDQDIFGPLVAGIAQLGRELGAASVQFQTARRGLVEKAKAAGFVAEGVVMSKFL